MRGDGDGGAGRGNLTMGNEYGVGEEEGRKSGRMRREWVFPAAHQHWQHIPASVKSYSNIYLSLQSGGEQLTIENLARVRSGARVHYSLRRWNRRCIRQTRFSRIREAWVLST